MIVFLDGTVHSISETSVDINVRGVGYRVYVPGALCSQLHRDEAVFLYTHQHFREDGTELYGFASDGARAWFELLLEVSGIGPKGALQIVAASDFEAFVAAISLEDVASLCRLPGVGKKTAQRMILELKDKLRTLATPEAAAASVAPLKTGVSQLQPTLAADVIEALQALGYNEKQAQQVVVSVFAENDQKLSLEDALRKCLQLLSPRGR